MRGGEEETDELHKKMKSTRDGDGDGYGYGDTDSGGDRDGDRGCDDDCDGDDDGDHDDRDFAMTRSSSRMSGALASSASDHRARAWPRPHRAAPKGEANVLMGPLLPAG